MDKKGKGKAAVRWRVSPGLYRRSTAIVPELNDTQWGDGKPTGRVDKALMYRRDPPSEHAAKIGAAVMACAPFANLPRAIVFLEESNDWLGTASLLRSIQNALAEEKRGGAHDKG